MKNLKKGSVAFIPILLVGIAILAALYFAKEPAPTPGPQGAQSGPHHYFRQQFFAGAMWGNVNSTSTTATTQTLQRQDIEGYDTIVFTPNTASVTLTFPASSTMPSFLPSTGQRQRTCFLNATTTAGTNVIFAAGTGIDLETASSSPTDLTLLAGNTACFEITRKKSSATTFDFAVSMTEFTDGD